MAFVLGNIFSVKSNQYNIIPSKNSVFINTRQKYPWSQNRGPNILSSLLKLLEKTEMETGLPFIQISVILPSIFRWWKNIAVCNCTVVSFIFSVDCAAGSVHKVEAPALSPAHYLTTWSVLCSVCPSTQQLVTKHSSVLGPQIMTVFLLFFPLILYFFLLFHWETL